MSTISEKLTQLNTIKGDIKTAINNKGGGVGDDFSTYATAINNLSGGSGETYENPEFYEVRTQKGTNYKYLFSGIDILNNDLDLSHFDSSNVTSMEYMFNLIRFTRSAVNGYVGEIVGLMNLDYSNVTSMNHMFNQAAHRKTNTFNLHDINAPKLQDVSHMFNYFESDNIDISNFNAPKLTNMNDMFSYCNSISININNFTSSKVYSMNSLFYYCTKLVDVIGYLDLSGLTNGFYASTYNNPVFGCKNLETLYLKNIYKNCTMTNASKWSINLSPTKIKDECLLYIINELPDLYAKGLTATDKITFTLPPTNTLTAEQVQPAIDKGWQVANVNY